MTAGKGTTTRVLLTFGVASLAAVALGAWICAASGVPTASWVRNLGAWGVGAVAAAVLAFAYRRAMLPVALCLAPLALGAAFLFPDQQCVHRWLDLGPVHANAAMLVLPAAVIALAALGGERRWPWIAALAAQAVLLLQPDASQATALGFAIAVAAFGAIRDGRQRLAVLLAAFGLAMFAWTRPDPLQPVAEVEEVIGLAWAWTPVAAVAAVLFLVGVVSAPRRATRGAAREVRLAASALGLLLAMWALTTLWGAFPVPFVGIGMSPIAGAWLGVGLLAGLARQLAPKA